MSIEYIFVEELKKVINDRLEWHKKCVLSGSLDSLEKYVKHVGVVTELETVKELVEDKIKSFEKQ